MPNSPFRLTEQAEIASALQTFTSGKAIHVSKYLVNGIQETQDLASRLSKATSEGHKFEIFVVEVK